MSGCTPKLDYGGNYEQWWKQMRAVLADKQLHWVCEQGHWSRNLSQSEREESAQASTTICNEVESRLLLRTPAEDLLEAPRLLNRLRELCKPFRLLDLPPELRTRIYDMDVGSLPTYDIDYSILRAFEVAPRACELPALSRVCRQVRAESLGLFISSTNFRMELPDCYCKEDALRINEIVRAWAENVAGPFIRHLRSVFFYVYPTSGWRLTFTEQKGLQIAYYNGDEDVEEEFPQLERFEQYFKGVEADRKALGMKGESIILAMLKDPLIWICDWE
ncbi:hypothetical protein PRZ48_010003 [Zasmidium cellare]|uniref:F-box domain-containing protein n=1 Tax=Zasmidium cellare TaxID=395010 RepID=A0ABR0EE60_ZASCE|nr:hypothetical protein PRZ48_010003 [Zasmidium cellare]